jgi:hypothetical protein
MLFRGLVAGAAGIAALDIFTYADMLLRARPASSLPSTVTQKLAETAGIGALANTEGEAPKNRRSGAGALLGYGVGLGAGIGYALLRPAVRGWLPWPVAGVILGAATLVASEGSATALGATDWSTWSAAAWISDIVPRAVYGLTVAAVVDRFDRESLGVAVVNESALVAVDVPALDHADAENAYDPDGPAMPIR